MKKILILSFILILMGSCSLDDDGKDFNLEILPIESVDIPDSFTMGQTYPITVSYLRPSTCHLFREFYYDKDNNIRTVAVIDYKYLNNNCEDLENELVEATFNFHVTSNGSYIFKFWQGEDDNGDNQYLIIEVPVTN
ncbi:hypothetical protein [Confluentibacter flavum]|uniref:GOLD domain-containing protein n=1 Tax=Confluentibacter flavum TaxID=1909700 RepID=A0A2N3HL90_9FLAO|nr:hypothetical protein [Confluentibacter flavum]PKQ45711.1 hypothetical protein CSW08_06485 [Confluentibacter flavum]